MTALERACATGVAFCAAYYGYLLAVALCWWCGRRR